MNLFSQNVTINNHRRRYLSVYQSRVTRFFVKNTFISNTTLKNAEHQSKAKQHPETEVLLFENY